MKHERTAIVGIMCLAIALCLPGNTLYAQEEAAPAELPEPGEPILMTMYLLRLEFNEQHALGSQTDTEDIKAAMRKSGIYGVQDVLRDEGALTLEKKGEQEGQAGVRITHFVGEEVPFITTFNSSGDDGGISRTTTQSTVQSGMTSRLRVAPTEDGKWIVQYDVTADRAYRKKKEEGPNLIGRTRINWEGTTTVDDLTPILIGRFTRDDEGSPVEYLVIYKVEQKG